MFRYGPASGDELERILDRARRAEPTYGALGATRAADLPEGFRHDRRQLALGGPDAFAPAKEGLRTWRAHAGAGARVFPGEDAVEGDTVLVLFRVAPVEVVAPCRVIYVVDQPDRFGLAYGTLPGHPESGEESFMVERDADGGTVFRITAFSRPSAPVVRLGAPLARMMQVRMTGRYLEALKHFVTGNAGP